MARIQQTAAVLLTAIAIAVGCAHAGREETVNAETGIARVWREELAILAAARLRCAQEELRYTYLGENVHLMQGCGQQIRYLIFERMELWVKIESFHDRAAFELSCDVEDLRVQRETDLTWAISGCGRQQRYSLRCTQPDLTCEWVRQED